MWGLDQKLVLHGFARFAHASPRSFDWFAQPVGFPSTPNPTQKGAERLRKFPPSPRNVLKPIRQFQLECDQSFFCAKRGLLQASLDAGRPEKCLQRRLVEGPGLGDARKSSSCLTAAGLPRLVSRPAALPLPRRRQRQQAPGPPCSGRSWSPRPPAAARRRTGLKLLAFVGARKVHAPVGEVLVVLELVGVVLENPELCGRRLLHVLGRTVHRLVGLRVVGPGRPLKAVAPLPALARHPRGRSLAMALRSSGRFVRCTASAGSSRSSVANSLPRSVVTTKFPSSPVSSRAARLVARPTVLAFLF